MTPQDQKAGYQHILEFNRPYKLICLAKDPFQGLVRTMDTSFKTLESARESAQKEMEQDRRRDIGFNLYFITRSSIEEIMAVDPVTTLPEVTRVWKFGV